MKKILILTASFGEGHNSAARGIRDAINQLALGARPEIRDIFGEAFGPINELARRAYLGVIDHAPHRWASLYSWIDKRRDYRAGLRWFYPARRRLAELIHSHQPDVIVSVYPAYPYFLDEIFQRPLTVMPKRIVCVTDSITINAIWLRGETDYFLVANEQTADVVAAAGIPREKLRVFGFPVNPEFAGTKQSRSSAPPWRILYMVNSGKGAAPELVRHLVKLPNTELTVTVGRDESLWRAVEGVRSVSAQKFRIIGWTTELPRLLTEHHVLISKAGGATVQEAIAAACPMIINQIVPGQEEGNAQLIRETNCGAIALDNAELITALQGALANDAQVLREWASNVSRISRPAAALEIAKFLLSL